jgi:hypothetical protein
MNRRTAIRNVVIITAGASLLPACSPGEEKSSLVLHKLKLTGNQEKLVASLADTILPASGHYIGAAGLKSHEFALVMVDDCTSPEEQKSFMDGLKAFDEGCKKKFSSSFAKCDAAQRKSWLTELESIKDPKATYGDAAGFYKTIKRYTIQSFTTGKQYLEEVAKWKLVPGPVFKGCVPV